MLLAWLPCATAFAADRVDTIIQRGRLRCGIESDHPGFAWRDSAGNYSGFDVDICRAIAASLLGSGRKVDFLRMDTLRDFTSSDTDIVSRRLSWSLSRAELPIEFGPIVFHDGQTFMVPAKSTVRSVQQLSGLRTCVKSGGSETRVANYFKSHLLVSNVKVYVTEQRAEEAFYAGECDAWSADLSELASARARREPHGQRSVLLAEIVSREPLSVVVRRTDERLLRAVRWSLYLLMQAEEQGIDQSNLEETRRAGALERRLEIRPGAIPASGLPMDWAYQVLHEVGNYADIFNRNLGSDTTVGIERGLNQSWRDGGLLYPPLMR